MVARRSGGALIDSTIYAADDLTLTTLNDHARETVYRRANGWVDSVVTRVAGKRFRIRYLPDSVFQPDSLVVTDSAGAVTFAARRYRYDPSFGTLDTVRVAGKTIAVHRDDDLRVDTVSWNTESRRLQKWNDIHRLAEYVLRRNADTLRLARYAYDSLARLEETWSPSAGVKYGYDGLGRLNRVERYEGPCSACTAPDTTGGYLMASDPVMWIPAPATAYDAAGNREFGYSLYAMGNRLVRTSADSLQYDADGNLTWRRTTSSGRTVTYSWSPTGLLDSVHVGSVGIRYLYDGSGRLLARRRNGVAERYFLWDGAQLLAELNGTLTQKLAEYVYLPGELDAPLAVVDDSSGVARVRYLSRDASGNVREVVNATTGVVEQTSAYDAWGAPEITGASANRLHWKGLLWEPDSVQLHYMRNRWYDPSLGRFISEDPIGLESGLNIYVFGEGDPINSTDPFGLRPCELGVDLHDDSPPHSPSLSVPVVSRPHDCRAENMLLMWALDRLSEAAHFAVGASDGATLGILAIIRGEIGLNEGISTDSRSYSAGYASGEAASAGTAAAKSLAKHGWRLIARRYPNTGGGGLSLLRNGRREFGLDWHRFTLKGREVNLPHYHRRPGIGKHRPWEGW